MTSITIPGNVTSIGTHAFESCSELTSVTIENGVTTIDEGAFSNTGLESIAIPSSVVNIPNPIEGSGEGIGVGINSITCIGRSIADVCDWLGITLDEYDDRNYGTLYCTDGYLESYDGYYSATYNT